MSGFGKANLNPTFEGPKYFKMRTPDPRKNETETVLVLRLLPSMHSYRDTGQWKFYYGQHYGYAGVNSRDPSKPRARPFGCIQKKNKAKEIETRCPKCDQISQFEAKKKAREDELAKANGIGNSDEDRKTPEFYELKKNDAKYQTIAGWLSKHNCDKKFWINAMDRDGNFGMLQLSYTTCEEKLMPLLNKLSKGEETGEAVDPFDPSSGMWLKFTRSGKAPRVVDNVTVFEDFVDVGGKKAKLAQPAPMTQDQIEKALKTCKDLKLDVVKFIDAATIQKLVECSGDPQEVDAIWPPEDFKKAAKPAEKKEETKEPVGDDVGNDPADDDLAADIPTPAATKAETAPSNPAPAPAASEDDAEEAALKAQMEALAQRKAAKAAAAKTASEVATTPAMGKSVDNPDDFLAQFNAK